MRKWWHLVMLATCAIGVVVIAVVKPIGSLSEERVDLSSYLLTKPKVLFSIPYGKGPSQVGIFIPDPEAEDSGDTMGPSDFAIGFDGSIYIADEQNGKVKKFSRDGELLMVTEGSIDRIASMTVDKQGRVYVIHGTLSNKVAVYNEKGKRLPDVEEKIERAAARLAEQLKATQPQLADEIFQGLGGIPSGEVRCDAAGNLYFRCNQHIVKINSQFTQAEIVKGYPLDEQGLYYYSYRYLPPEREKEALVYGVDGSLITRIPMGILERAEMTIHSPDGLIVRKFTLPQGEWSEVERLVPIGGSDIFCDGRGHFYTARSPIAVYHISLREDNPEFFAVHFDAVLEYNDEGNFVGVRAIINNLAFAEPFRVDKEGNVYWLDFKADHLDVMMAPAP